MRLSASCHVLVAGAGPAGLAAAIALAARGIDVLVADPGPPKPTLERCEMLPAAAEAILSRLGLVRVLARSVALRGVVSLWGTAQPVDHAAASPGLSQFGWSVDRAELQASMRQRADGLGIEACGGRVRSVTGEPGAWEVLLGGGPVIRARYLVDATGRPAAIARRLGARAVFGSPLVAWIWSTAQEAPPYLLAEARPDGWAFSLPRPDGGGSVGYLMYPGGRRQPVPPLKGAMSGTRLVPSPAGHPAAKAVDSRSMRLFPVAAPGWLAAGDAAAAFDPVASQGLFNALSGGFFAGNAAADALTEDESAVDIYRTLSDRTAARTHRRITLQYAMRPYKTPFWTRMSRQFPFDRRSSR